MSGLDVARALGLNPTDSRQNASHKDWLRSFPTTGAAGAAHLQSGLRLGNLRVTLKVFRDLVAIDDATPARTENVKLRLAAAGFVLGALPVKVTAAESQNRRC